MRSKPSPGYRAGGTSRTPLPSAQTSSKPICLRAAPGSMQTRTVSGGHASRFLVSPRATAQLQREIIEFASADEAAPPIDLDTLVHMLLSITSEQNMRPEFAGDVPTDAEVAKLQRDVPTMGLEDTLEYAKTIIPDEVASSLFNLPAEIRDCAVEHRRLVVHHVAVEIEDHRPGRDACGGLQDRHRCRSARRDASRPPNRQAQHRENKFGSPAVN